MTPNEGIISIAQNISNWWAAVRADRAAKKGWSSSGKITIPPTTVGGRPRATGGTSLQANFKEPGYYTLQFSILPLGNWSAFVSRRAKAIITWSVEGNSVRRIISVVDGVCISGTGQGVNVQISDDSYIETPPTTENMVYLASVQVTKGTRPGYGNTQPILLPDEDGGFEDSIGAGLSKIWSMQDQAGINSVWINLGPSTVALTNIDISFLNSGGPTGVISLVNAEKSVGKWLPIPPGTASIRIDNNGAATIRAMPLWGVEG